MTIQLIPYDRRTIVRFSKSLTGNFETLLNEALQNIYNDEEQHCIPEQGTEYVAEYRIKRRLPKNYRRKLIQILYDSYELTVPESAIKEKWSNPHRPRKLPKTKTFKNASRKQSDIIIGFVGNLLFGDLEYLYK